MYNILIVYCYNYEYPVRTTSKDWLDSFERYSGHWCYYLNLYFSELPEYITKIQWDLIIFPHFFTSTRWDPKEFQKMIGKIQLLKKIDATKILFNQDEFIQTNVLSDFINEFDINIVFSCAKESEWRKIYSKIDFDKVRILRVLTGYIEDSTVKRINKLSEAVPERIFDIGYRAYDANPSLGRHGQLKVDVAHKIKDAALGTDLVVDISLKREDTFLGDDWYNFLLKCKYTIGVEGGASLLDPDGSFFAGSILYKNKNPTAGFEEVEHACFPNIDGNLELFAISPRHLEACITKTCQILIEGEYNGILKAGIHYIELKKDFSNIHEVIELVKQDQLRKKITEQAYRDIVGSEKYTYKHFVEFVLNESMIGENNKISIRKLFNDCICYRYYLDCKNIEIAGWKSFQNEKNFHIDTSPHVNSLIKFPNVSYLKNIIKKIKFYIMNKYRLIKGKGI